jgi:hypothetical protein
VHRDLSPRNMMVSFSGEVKIIDFGLVRGNLDRNKTQPGMLLGTLRYVSPEQAMTTPVDRRSDLYTLSVVLHEMLTGRIIVPDGKPVDVLRHVVRERPQPVTALNPSLPKALDDVIARGLSKRAEDRWPDARTYSDALREAAGQLAGCEASKLGEFVRFLFKNDEANATSLVARGHDLAAARGDADPDSFTRTGVLPDPGSKTKTEYMRPRSEGETLDPDPGSKTRTQLVGADQTKIVPDLQPAAARRSGLTPAVSMPAPYPSSTVVPGEPTMAATQPVIWDQSLVPPRGRAGVSLGVKALLALLAVAIGGNVYFLTRPDPPARAPVAAAPQRPVGEPGAVGPAVGERAPDPVENAHVGEPPRVPVRPARDAKKRTELKPLEDAPAAAPSKAGDNLKPLRALVAALEKNPGDVGLQDELAKLLRAFELTVDERRRVDGHLADFRISRDAESLRDVLAIVEAR